MTELGSEVDLRLVVAALAVEDDLTQREIAAIIDKSQAEVSRLYRDAVARGWVHREVRWPDGANRAQVDGLVFKHRPELQSRLERLSRQAGEKGPVPFQKVHIVYGEDAKWELFARRASVLVGDMLRGATVIGVAWGRNVDRVLKAMPNLPADPSKIVLPVAGEPFKYQAQVGATDAAELLGTRLGTQKIEHLRGVGARLPPHLASPENITTIRAYLAASPSYGRIFGPNNDPDGPLIERLDLVLTGIGSTATSDASADPLYRETKEAEAANCPGRGERSLEQAAVGNVGGWYLPKDVDSDADRRIVEGVNSHWFGIRIESLVGCAARASRSRPKRPGVVVVAPEPEKAETVLAAVRAGVVSQLIVSRRLAERLLKTPD